MIVSFFVEIRILFFAFFLWLLGLFLFCIRRRIEIRLIVRMPSFFYLCRGFLFDCFGFGLLLYIDMDDHPFVVLLFFSRLKKISFVVS